MAPINIKAIIFVALACLLTACSAYESGQQVNTNRNTDASIFGNFALSQQVAPPPEIQSIQLYPQGNETAAPIIKLAGNQQLVLEFDHLDASVRQFKVSVSHRAKNWEESPIGATIYLDSFFETYFGDGRRSTTQTPAYHHYTYRFPNQQLRMTQSGNYLLSVFDYDSNNLLFRIPFFITEDAGTLSTRIETLFAQRNDSRNLAQPFSEYRYPAFVQQPQFNLSFSYAQNQFWGRMRKTDLFDTATAGVVNFHLGRNQSFIADYEFLLLDLNSFRPDGRQIIDFRPGEVPPVITLRRDVQQFDSRPNQFPGSALGIPRNDQQAEYGIVNFSFEATSRIPKGAQLYLMGDFNNWMIDSQYRMRYDSTRSLWEGQALIKQGLYAYKYVLLADNTIDDLSLDHMFTEPQQEYITFVYFRDPRRNFDRLLKVDIISE